MRHIRPNVQFGQKFPKIGGSPPPIFWGVRTPPPVSTIPESYAALSPPVAELQPKYWRFFENFSLPHPSPQGHKIWRSLRGAQYPLAQKFWGPPEPHFWRYRGPNFFLPKNKLRAPSIYFGKFHTCCRYHCPLEARKVLRNSDDQFLRNVRKCTQNSSTIVVMFGGP